ncbi:MAG: ABC transporter permease subunit [Acidobacteriota bacterium]|nr:ABC transporter permease subunit [Acidobacteriota bacterium]
MSLVRILIDYREAILDGLGMTLKLCVVIWTLGIVVGTLLGILANQWRSGLGWFVRGGSFVLSGIPILVLLFWLHYPLQSVLGVVIDPFYTAIAALSLMNIVSVAELVAVTLRDFPAQYVMAARVCGLSSKETIRRIQLPIIFRQILPGLLLRQVTVLQATLFASLISVDEIFRVAQRINAVVYRPVEVYTGLGIFFLLICLPMNGLALYLEARFTRDLSEV